MPQLEWLPEQAGGMNLWEDPSSLPMHQMVQLDNYYPVGKRWRLIQGNDVVSPGTTTPRVRHLVEYQIDDAAGGTTKTLLSMKTTGIFNAETDVALVGAPVASSQTLRWDTTVFTGIMLMANGSDNLVESSNGTTFAATSGSPPSAPRYVEAWKNRVFLAGRDAAPLSVHYCADGDRTTWTGSDAGTEVITSPVGDFVTGIRSLENYLAIFTRRTITVLLGDHPDDWTKRTIYEDHGCTSHRTIARVNGGMVYANDQGVWLLNADLKRMELSKEIRPYWSGDNSTETNALGVARNLGRSQFMHAVYDPTPDKNRYYIWVSEGSSTKEDVCWIFHFNTGQWSRMTTFMDANQTSQASCLREDSSGNVQPYFAAGADDNTSNDKRVYKISSAQSFASRTGGNITATLKTGILTSPYIPQAQLLGILTTKRWVDIFLKLTGTTTASQSVSYTFRGFATDTAVDQRTISQTFTSASASIVRPRVPISVRGWGFQITMTYTGQIRHSFLGGIINFQDAGEV